MPRALVAMLSLLLVAPAGDPVARVLGSRGAVKVKRAGQQLEPLAEGAALFEADVLVVPPGGLLVLRVERNEQLVRVDEDVELPLSGLAALRAPRAAQTLEQQLSRVLTPREQQELGRERLAGWVVRPHAANVAAAGAESASAREVLKARIEEKRRERELDRRMDRLTRDDGLFDDADRRLTRTEQRTVAEASTPGLQSGGETPLNTFTTVTGSDPRVQVGNTGRGVPGDEDELEALELQLRTMESARPTALDEPTRGCLLQSLEALSAEAKASLGASLTLTLRRGQAARSVALEADLPVPACVQAWADSAGAGLGEGEQVVLEIPLP
ncbi:MAG: hypothetical protein RL653_334 [Pseudomonadota bacterium]|jgi:hypothetical protein